MSQQRSRWLGSLLVAAICGCGPYVEGSAVPTHTADDAHFVDAGSVRVSALAIPGGAAEVGIVQARVTGGNIEDVSASTQQDVSGYRFEKEFVTDDGQLVIVRIYKR